MGFCVHKWNFTDKNSELLMLDIFSVAFSDMACQKTGCHSSGWLLYFNRRESCYLPVWGN